jgi:hypothetical protein
MYYLLSNSVYHPCAPSPNGDFIGARGDIILPEKWFSTDHVFPETPRNLLLRILPNTP